ncbi:hypothetical protein TWF281_004416 [Arthrobotrys megalospora]
MWGYSKPLLWKFGVLTALIFFEGVQGYVVPVVEEDAGGYMKLVKRVNEDGHPIFHLDLHERWNSDEVAEILEKRDEEDEEKGDDVFKLLPEPSQEEKDMFKDSFDVDCGTRTPKIAGIQELYGTAMTIMSRQGHYNIDGWSTSGIIALGNQATDPKKYQTEIPIHCLGGEGKNMMVLEPVNANEVFKYGVSLSRTLVAKLINSAIYRCMWTVTEDIPRFSIRPKLKRLSFVRINVKQESCEDVVGPVCKSTDDQSKAECLATKSLLGVKWTETKPTPTKPNKAKK